MQEYVGICRKARICRNMSEYAGIWKSMREYAGICTNMQEYVRTFGRQDYAGICITNLINSCFNRPPLRQEQPKGQGPPRTGRGRQKPPDAGIYRNM